MLTPTKDGSTLRDQLMVVKERTGKLPPELEEEPELDEMFQEAWYWFLRLHSKRQSNGFGVGPITFSEIQAFFNLIQYQPQSWEVEIIEIFDNIALSEFDKQREKEMKDVSKSNK